MLRNLQTSRANNSRILRIRHVKFSRYCFYVNTNIQEEKNIPLKFQVFMNKHPFYDLKRQNVSFLVYMKDRIAPTIFKNATLLFWRCGVSKLFFCCQNSFMNIMIN